MKTLENIIAERDIKSLTHFTPIANLDSILQNGIVARSFIDTGKLNGICCDNDRADGLRNGICLSVSYPNSKMFFPYRLRMKDNPFNKIDELDWAVIILDISIILHKKCAFFDTNAACAKFRNVLLDDLKTAKAFENMFANEVITRDGELVKRESYLKPKDTTCVQAEVMVFEKIEPSFIKFCVVQKKKKKKRLSEEYSQIKFYSMENTHFTKSLFSDRKIFRSNQR